MSELKLSHESFRRQILSAGRELFDIQGFDNTSLQDVLDQLKMSEQQFLLYFESLDHLLEELWSGR